MNNIVPQDYAITRAMRSELKKHQPLVIWFTGLSGSGKSTISNAVEKALFEKGIHTYTLDGDNIRGGLNKNLGFTEEDRTENLRRIAEVAKLFLNAGEVVLSAFITPLESDRNLIREIVEKENFVEVFVNTSLEECERRDVKGLYKKARAGEIPNFTGISAPFEKPNNPSVEIRTEEETIERSAQRVLDHILPIIQLKHNE
ncbi:adenylyl-sulfate kinase [Salinimicrobium sediminilitoris]|uniref:adenylyl-sulfate kinase n=1 Tax=Salinimicrobium sediminilitoris TaxID=2876715 RepID=UPI001E3B9633|nr:adenylyl-sulfate kinase [Salinimicrobium sediminilitoris]MCC8358468.1 adenylyl-sulfate kinase [Salinimicrobium sediminilitoris]